MFKNLFALICRLMVVSGVIAMAVAIVRVGNAAGSDWGGWVAIGLGVLLFTVTTKKTTPRVGTGAHGTAAFCSTDQLAKRGLLQGEKQ